MVLMAVLAVPAVSSPAPSAASPPPPSPFAVLAVAEILLPGLGRAKGPLNRLVGLDRALGALGGGRRRRRRRLAHLAAIAAAASAPSPAPAAALTAFPARLRAWSRFFAGFGFRRFVLGFSLLGEFVRSLFLDRGEGGRGRSSDLPRGVGAMHLLAAVDHEGLRPHHARIGRHGNGDVEALLKRAQMTALLVEHVERDLGAG